MEQISPNKQILADVIRKKTTHKDYARVTELSKLYTKLVTGVGMDDLLKPFNPRENDEMFKQRVRLTQHISKTVAQNVMDIFYKVPRSNSIQRNVSYIDNNISKLNDFNKIISEFWGDESLDDYMSTRWFELNFTDPNAFVVVEWKKFDNSSEYATPYPFEVSCESAIDFKYINNDLEYLISKETYVKEVFERGADIKKTIDKYTLYGRNSTITITKVIDDDVSKKVLQGSTRQRVNQEQFIGDYFIPYNTDDVYLVQEFEHGLGYVPALRIGFKRDLATNGRTYVSPLDKATPVFMKMIKANSELDLTMALHAFPQKIQMSPNCKAQSCNRGLTPNGEMCPVCGGTGFETIKTAQDTITIAMPKNAEDVIKLDNIIRYEYPPVELVKFQDSYIDKLTVFVKEAVFNTELFSRKEVSETATGKNISLQNVYDSLYTVAKAYSKVWKFLVTTVADATDLNEGLICFYNFSKDFKLKSLTDLYIDLKMVGDARASEFVKSSIEQDIASIIYSEDEVGLKKYNIKQSFFPFSGKTPEQIAMIVGGNTVSKFTKVFWANFGVIFDELELEQAENGVNFYTLNRKKMYELIKIKVDTIISELDTDIDEPKIDLNGQ